jgi:hypothetical protein
MLEWDQGCGCQLKGHCGSLDKRRLVDSYGDDSGQRITEGEVMLQRGCTLGAQLIHIHRLA